MIRLYLRLSLFPLRNKTAFGQWRRMACKGYFAFEFLLFSLFLFLFSMSLEVDFKKRKKAKKKKKKSMVDGMFFFS
jgi:hypothetical protein